MYTMLKTEAATWRKVTNTRHQRTKVNMRYEVRLRTSVVCSTGVSSVQHDTGSKKKTAIKIKRTVYCTGLLVSIDVRWWSSS